MRKEKKRALVPILVNAARNEFADQRRSRNKLCGKRLYHGERSPNHGKIRIFDAGCRNSLGRHRFQNARLEGMKSIKEKIRQINETEDMKMVRKLSAEILEEL
jgi:hypothetical protein